MDSNIIGRVSLLRDIGPCTIRRGRYPNGKLAIYLLTDDKFQEAALKLSINTDDEMGPEEFAVKTYSENQPHIGVLFQTGLFEDTGRRVQLRFDDVPVWRLKQPSIHDLATTLTYRMAAARNAALEEAAAVVEATRAAVLPTSTARRLMDEAARKIRGLKS